MSSPVKPSDPDSTAPEATEHDDSSSTNASPPPPSPFERFGLSGTSLSVANWLAVVLGIYVLITAVGVIGDGFQSATGGQAEELFTFAAHPVVGLMIGVVATALIQSSTTVTSIIVGLAAGGLPMATAVPMLMGANMGTTLTSTLVSLGMVRDKDSFRRAFAAASVHDMYNLLAVLIFLPLELMFGLLERVSGFFTEQLTGTDGGIVSTVFTAFGDAVSFVTDPLADLIVGAGELLPDPWAGIALIVVGIGLILASVNFIGSLLKVVMVGRAKDVLHNAIGRGPVSGVLSGTLITVMVQSSSTTTSLMVPLAGSGTFSVRQIYPFTVGANIGTTLTALIAAFGFSGIEAAPAMQAALVHLLYNLFAALVIFCLPFLRRIPTWAATTLARFGADNKLYVVAWVLGVFLILPGALIFLSVIL